MWSPPNNPIRWTKSSITLPRIRILYQVRHRSLSHFLLHQSFPFHLLKALNPSLFLHPLRLLCRFLRVRLCRLIHPTLVRPAVVDLGSLLGPIGQHLVAAGFRRTRDREWRPA